MEQLLQAPPQHPQGRPCIDHRCFYALRQHNEDPEKVLTLVTASPVHRTAAGRLEKSGASTSMQRTPGLTLRSVYPPRPVPMLLGDGFLCRQGVPSSYGGGSTQGCRRTDIDYAPSHQQPGCLPPMGYSGPTATRFRLFGVIMVFRYSCRLEEVSCFGVKHMYLLRTNEQIDQCQ